MSAQKSVPEFHAAVQNVNATDGWDVMVSYSQDPLNALLQEAWGKCPKFSNVSFKHSETINKATKITMIRDFTLDLSSPVLQFDASESQSRAILVMVINGSYKTTVFQNEKPIGQPGTDHIAKDAYQLKVFLPIAGISGDTVHKPGNVIKLDEKKTTEVAMIFHFANDEAVYKMEKADQKKRESDDLMDTITAEIQGWFQSKNHVDWIDISISKISNQRPLSGDTETLRPRSFVIRSQPGYLNVFIATKNKPGRPHPHFEHKGNDELAPVPTGFEASIFISNKLFVNFLAEQFKYNFTGLIKSIKPEAIEGGMGLVIQMGDPPSWNIGSTGIEDYSIPEFSVDFDAYPVTVSVKDNSSLETIPKWSWAPKTDATWYLVDKRVPELITYEWGTTRISGSLEETGKLCGSIDGDELQLSIALDNATSLPTMSYTAKWVEGNGGRYGYVAKPYDVPDTIRNQVKFRLPAPLKAQLKGLNFFSAQNVFVPGVRFIKATTQIMPTDVVLLGTMPRSTTHTANPAAIVQSLSAQNLALRFMDEIYHNAYFLGDLINANVKGDAGTVKAVLHKRGYADVTAQDLEVLRDYVTPGPNFDLRYAGGAYSVDSPGYTAKELLVHSVHRTIYIDGTPVESQKTLGDGSVTFISSDSQQSFHITFTVPFDVQGETGGKSFIGSTWATANPDQKEQIQGRRTFPWDGRSDIGTSLAASARDDEALKFLPLALDLTTPHDPQEFRAVDITSVAAGFAIAVNAVTSAKNLKAGCVWVSKVVMKMAGIKLSLSVPGLLDLDKMAKEFPVKAEEAVNKTINQAIEEKKRKKEKIVLDPVVIGQAARPKILEEMKKYMHSKVDAKAVKDYGAAYGLSALNTTKMAHEAADTQAANVFDGEQYGSYLDAMVDRAVTTRRMEKALENKISLDEEIREAKNRFLQNKELKKNQEADLAAREKEAKRDNMPEEEWNGIKEKYERQIKEIADKITEDEKEIKKNEEKSKGYDEAWKDSKENEKLKKELEKKRKEEFWKHRKEHPAEPYHG
ncbi:uncharacterized protein N7506_001832 [Penicillium brevicompactum]|uniref:uncharacterized protein n=1 Tax=Penicillium brevicompactum TaxID=5074 RepID=UPI002540984A|nr:uncharacterized protein N7506_001832 [Penicillium brevicompactum]KAJ5348579.1 hypothetical protein N7506_001832 [Penicillium brevicompactum]